MLTIHGSPTRFGCDGVARRSFLKIGALSFGAASLSLADVYRAQAADTRKSPGNSRDHHRSIINIFLGGGPPHQDMFDLKLDAPAEIRGEMKPIGTNVPGIQISEVFPQIAKMMDKFAIIRSVVGAGGGHDAIQCTTGFRDKELSAIGGRPSIGAVLSRIHGPADPSVPPFVGLAERTGHGPWADPGKVGFLGSTFAPFRPNGPDLANMTLNSANKASLNDRKALRNEFDNLRREMDANGALTGLDAHTERALGVLTSSKLVEALDLSKEDPKIREKYGTGKPYKFQFDGAPTNNEHLLIARRLVQAGARCVSLSYGRWDSHSKNFDLVRDHGTKLDQCLSTLIWDLDRLGILNDTTVVCWGEFGRTPRINKEAGRDHWPQVSCALLAGGGLRTGQVIGSTNRLGEYAKDRPVTFGEIFATLYHSLGLNLETTTIPDPTGRPLHLTDGPALRELV
jgi:hypothetical protein